MVFPASSHLSLFPPSKRVRRRKLDMLYLRTARSTRQKHTALGRGMIISVYSPPCLQGILETTLKCSKEHMNQESPPASCIN